MKKTIIILVILFVVFVAVTLLIARTFFPDNVAETAPDGGAKDLKTRVYKTDLANAAKVAAETIPTLSSWGSNWKLTENKIENGTAIIKAEVPVVFFTDDLEVKIKQLENGISLDVRSNSRVGKSDFGENRRHIVQILEALDKKIGER
jgi:uncharacterized protein YpmB